jgi:hypothetical protein
MKFRNNGQQFAKSDIIDIANALGIKIHDRMTVTQIRAKLEAAIPCTCDVPNQAQCDRHGPNE